jgi:2-(1,2-epoxy-1,2-dihydrophenyl)acetyl-CoA isomerase
MTDPILLTRDGAVATLTLNRPAALNALDAPMMDALVAHTSSLAADATLRVLVVRGAGRHFMAGGDLRDFARRIGQPPPARAAEFERLIGRLHAAIEHLHRMPQPIVAGVHGAVAGFGMSLMCACDLAIAADDAYFTSAYRHIGLTPDGGATWALPRIVGLRRALEILLLGERFDAQEALRIGLVNRVVPAADLDRALAEVVGSLVAGPATAIANVKRLARTSPDRTLSEQLRAEAASFGQCAATPDFVEGIEAFIARRKPHFGGRRDS